MPNPSKYPGTEKGYKQFMNDCMHQTLHIERKEKEQSVGQCLNMWRQEHGPKHPGKTKKMASIAGFLQDMASELSDKTKGFISNIEKDTIDNTNFRKVIYTGKNSQLVLMSLKPGEDIGEEIHEDTDQFFRVEKGTGSVIINGDKQPILDGSAIVIPKGAKHNVINEGKEPLSLYSIYSPPHHADKTVHKTKEEAKSDKEHFDGKTTE